MNVGKCKRNLLLKHYIAPVLTISLPKHRHALADLCVCPVKCLAQHSLPEAGGAGTEVFGLEESHVPCVLVFSLRDWGAGDVKHLLGDVDEASLAEMRGKVQRIIGRCAETTRSVQDYLAGV